MVVKTFEQSNIDTCTIRPDGSDFSPLHFLTFLPSRVIIKRYFCPHWIFWICWWSIFKEQWSIKRHCPEHVLVSVPETQIYHCTFQTSMKIVFTRKDVFLCQILELVNSSSVWLACNFSYVENFKSKHTYIMDKWKPTDHTKKKNGFLEKVVQFEQSEILWDVLM